MLAMWRLGPFSCNCPQTENLQKGSTGETGAGIVFFSQPMSPPQANDSSNWLMIHTKSTLKPKVDEQHDGIDCKITLDFAQEDEHFLA